MTDFVTITAADADAAAMLDTLAEGLSHALEIAQARLDGYATALHVAAQLAREPEAADATGTEALEAFITASRALGPVTVLQAVEGYVSGNR